MKTWFNHGGGVNVYIAYLNYKLWKHENSTIAHFLNNKMNQFKNCLNRSQSVDQRLIVVQ